MALTEYDKKHLSTSDQKKIQQATAKWEAANKSGDTKGMEAAANEAATIRNNAGYKTDSSGNYTGSYSGGSSKGGNSQYTGSSNGVKVNTSYQQSLKDEMNANSIAWWNADANEKQRLEQRNQEISKILGGTVSYNPTTGTWSGSAGGFDASDIVDWEYYDEPRPTAPTRDPRIDEMLDEILNRDSFSYDVTNDPLYKQYAERYQREGDRATRNTLAEVAAGAGGMNSYAITAAQQANNYYNSQLNDVIPQLYEAAYQRYLADIDNKVRDLGILNKMDDTQYGRYRDTMNDWAKDKAFAYGLYQDAANQNNWQTNFDYTDEWKNKEWDAYLDEIEYGREQDAYNKSETAKDKEYNKREKEKAEALALIEWYINNGVTTIDAELIKKAGLNQTAINQMIANNPARQGITGTPTGGGGGGRSGGGGGNPKSNSQTNTYTPSNPQVNPVQTSQSPKVPPSFEKQVENIYTTRGAWEAAKAMKEAMATGVISMSEYMRLSSKFGTR